MFSLYFDQNGDKAYDFGYSLGYFIGNNVLFLLVGFLIIAGLFIFFLRKRIRNNQRQIKN